MLITRHYPDGVGARDATLAALLLFLPLSLSSRDVFYTRQTPAQGFVPGPESNAPELQHYQSNPCPTSGGGRKMAGLLTAVSYVARLTQQPMYLHVA